MRSQGPDSQADRLVLILGGARSGKSAFAERLARESGRDVIFLATAMPSDEEMRARIAAHRQARPATWRTIEAPLRPSRALAKLGGFEGVVLLDCLTLLCSNLLLALDPAAQHEGHAVAAAEPSHLSDLEGTTVEERALAEVRALLEVHRAGRYALIVVSNEVGLGLVPAYPLGRAYRDLLGRANQLVAAAAGRVYFMVAGLPVDVKRLALEAGLPASSAPAR